MTRILLISETVPPMVSSVAVILGRVFKLFPKDSLSVLTAQPANSQYGIFDGEKQLNGEHFYVDLPAFLSRRKHSRWLANIYDLLRIPLIVWKGFRIVRRRKINKIITTTYGGFEVAAYLISKLTGKPLFIYLLDLYVDIEQRSFKRAFRRIFARRFFQSAAGIFVMSEPLGEYLEETYGVNSTVIPHPVELSKYENIQPHKPSPGKRTIVYTGMIYDAHRDCMLDLIQAIRDLPDVELQIYTPRPVASLEREGIHGHNVKVSFITHHAVPAVQKGADILFLPMSFNSPYPEVIRTASPGKISEYLAAGRPILVYAPPYSYVAQYARSHGFGLVVDQKGSNILGQELLRILNNKELREDLIAKSAETVVYHEAERVANLFMREISIHSGN